VSAKARAKQRETWRRTVSAVLSTAEGRAFAWGLLERANTFGSSYTGEALSGAYAEGRRSIGLDVMRELQTLEPSHYSLMVREQTDARTRELLETAANTPTPAQVAADVEDFLGA